MAPSAPAAVLKPQVFGAAALVWVASYVVPLYFLPQTLFAALWLAVLAWGLVLCGSPSSGAGMTPFPGRLACGITAYVVFVAATHNSLIGSVILLIAGVVFLFGRYVSDQGWLRFLLAALVVAAIFSVGIALIQLLYPNSDFALIAPLATPTRATANLRQPNLFAQLLLLASIAWVFLQCEPTPRSWALRLSVALAIGAGLAFSQSRTGLLGLFLLLLWSALDSGLPRRVRQIPLVVAAGCAAVLAAMLIAADASGTLTHIQTQQSAGSDISASRFRIWSNTLSLIAMSPWTGVGWGNFAQAWALTPFPDRPPAAFDNAHNLPLHLMVELGVPFALLLMTGLGWALWRTRLALRAAHVGEQAVQARCLAMMLVMLGLHSLFEYPLWYTFFLLPAAFILGQLLQRGARARMPSATVDSGHRASTSGLPGLGILFQVAGVLIVLGSLYAAWDYARVLQVFRPFAAGIFQPLEERIEQGRKSVLFGYWVDYAAVTNTETFKGLDAQMHRAFTHRMNPHMLMVYAQYLAEKGEKDKASYVADRLREFNNPVSKEFFEVCNDPIQGSNSFQCVRPTGSYSFRDFL